MRTVAESSAALDAIAEEIGTHSATLFRGLSANPSVLLVPAGRSFADVCGSGPRVLRLAEGALVGKVHGKALFTVEAGDLFGLESVFPSLPPLEYASDFAVRADCFDWPALSQVIRGDAQRFEAWSALLAATAAFFMEAAGAALRLGSVPQPEVRWFEPQEVIIAQGSRGPEVFTLVEGHADVRVDGVSVGEVRADEIFGALAAITQTPRTASVIADQRSMVLAMARDNFVELLGARPGTIRKLLEDLARMVVSLNSRVVEHQKR